MPDKKKIALKDYKPNFIPEAIEVTMEELNMTREEAIRFMTEISYQLHYGKQGRKKKKTA